jgi:hypothetical protein
MTIPPSVDTYLAGLPAERRAALAAVRAEILAHLPAGYEEGMQYGMIGYYVPHSVFPAGYHGDPTQPLPFAHLGAQKSHMALYLMSVYGDPALQAWFVEEYKRSGKKLDMGKACVRFATLGDLPLELIGRTVARVPVDTYIAAYERLVPASARRPAGSGGASGTASAKSAASAGTRASAKPPTASAKTAKAARAARASGRSASR